MRYRNHIEQLVSYNKGGGTGVRKIRAPKGQIAASLSVQMENSDTTPSVHNFSLTLGFAISYQDDTYPYEPDNLSKCVDEYEQFSSGGDNRNQPGNTDNDAEIDQ